MFSLRSIKISTRKKIRYKIFSVCDLSGGVLSLHRSTCYMGGRYSCTQTITGRRVVNWIIVKADGLNRGSLFSVKTYICYYVLVKHMYILRNLAGWNNFVFRTLVIRGDYIKRDPKNRCSMQQEFLHVNYYSCLKVKGVKDGAEFCFLPINWYFHVPKHLDETLNT